MKNTVYDRCKKMANGFTLKRNVLPVDTGVVAFGELIKIACYEIKSVIDIASVFKSSSAYSKKYLTEARCYLDEIQVLIESYRTHMDNQPVQIMLPSKAEYWNFIFYGANKLTKTEGYKNLMDINEEYSITEHLLEEMGRRVKLARSCIMNAFLEAVRMFGKSKESTKLLLEVDKLFIKVKDKLDEVTFSELQKKGYQFNDIVDVFYGDGFGIHELIRNHYDNIMKSNLEEFFIDDLSATLEYSTY